MVSEQVATSTSGFVVAGESSIRLNPNTITWMTFNIYTLTPTPSKNPKAQRTCQFTNWHTVNMDASKQTSHRLSFQIIPMACEVKEGIAKSWSKALRASESLCKNCPTCIHMPTNFKRLFKVWRREVNCILLLWSLQGNGWTRLVHWMFHVWSTLLVPPASLLGQHVVKPKAASSKTFLHLVRLGPGRSLPLPLSQRCQIIPKRKFQWRIEFVCSILFVSTQDHSETGWKPTLKLQLRYNERRAMTKSGSAVTKASTDLDTSRPPSGLAAGRFSKVKESRKATSEDRNQYIRTL